MKELATSMRFGIGLCVILLVSGAFSGCAPKKGNVVEGVLLGNEGQGVQVELRKWVPGRTGQAGEFVALDATFSDMEGNFTLEPKENLVMDFYQLMVSKSTPMVLIMDSTMHIHVEATVPPGGFIVDAKVEGSSASQEASVYYSKAMPMQATMGMLRAAMQNAKDNEKRQELSDRSTQLKNDINDWSKSFIQDHKGSPASLGPLEHLDIRSNQALFEGVLKSTKTDLENGSYHQALTAALAAETAKAKPMNAKRAIQNGNGANAPRPKKNAKYGIGDAAPEIVMNDPDGKTRKLSDLRGKMVLIDFWASWCGPCRRENPTLVRAYDQYKSKGFEVFSVSLDKDVDRWTRAIEQDGLVWPNHVSDLTGWSNAAGRSYGVHSVPHAVLIDQEGTIVATHLRGSMLLAKLNELLP